jgi:hypothetical protein
MTRTLVVLLFAASLALGGCGKKSDETSGRTAQEKAAAKAIEKGTDGKAKVDVSKGKTTIETQTGEKIEVASGAEGVKLPDEFPKDVLVYKGAKVESSVKTPDGTQLMLSTADAPDKVAEAYKAEMKRSGWEEKTSMVITGMTMLEYTKNQRTATVQVMGEDGKGGKGAKVILMVAKEKGAAK